MPAPPLPPGQQGYLSDAQFFVTQHLKAEADLTKPTAYVFNYNNVGWAAQVRGGVSSCNYGTRSAAFLEVSSV
jgi:hypothetical protein